jgi:cholesterol transport system auxiliary component
VLGAIVAAATWPTYTTGCALLSRGESLHVDWYSPERTAPSAGVTEPQALCTLRFGRVTSGADFGPRIAYGDGVYTIGYYDGRRWTERPEHYVRRAVERTLFEEGAFRRRTVGAPTLDLELIDFDEVKTPAVHAARVAVRVLVTGDDTIQERTIETAQIVAGERFEDFVAAMARALDGTAHEVARAARVMTGCQ